MIVESTRKAIDLLSKKGIKVILNTGRSYFSLNDLHYLDNLHFDGLVVDNGGTLILGKTPLKTNYFNENDANNIISFLEKYNINYGITTFDKVYGKTFEQGAMDQFYSVFDEPRSLDISQYSEENISKITYFASSEFDELIKKEFPNFFISRFFSIASEISIRPFKKNEGIIGFLNYFNIKKENAMAFGDDLNDLDMFNEVKYGIAVGNGNKELLKQSKYVIEDINQDSIYKYLKNNNIF